MLGVCILVFLLCFLFCVSGFSCVSIFAGKPSLRVRTGSLTTAPHRIIRHCYAFLYALVPVSTHPFPIPSRAVPSFVFCCSSSAFPLLRPEASTSRKTAAFGRNGNLNPRRVLAQLTSSKPGRGRLFVLYACCCCAPFSPEKATSSCTLYGWFP